MVKQNGNDYKAVTFTGDYSTNEWTKKIKPYIIQFFPKSKNHIFEENRDIHYIVGLIDFHKFIGRIFIKYYFSL